LADRPPSGGARNHFSAGSYCPLHATDAHAASIVSAHRVKIGVARIGIQRLPSSLCSHARQRSDNILAHLIESGYAASLHCGVRNALEGCS
jgi:hypothetical protein